MAAPSSAVVRQAEPKKSGGAGKSFIFGFLGALLACAIAFGGMAFAGVFNPGTPVVGSSAVIGSTNQSVINAAEEGQTLAEAVAAKALPSVVAIYNYQNQSASYGYGFGHGYGANNSNDDSLVATGMGSGVVISDDGYIITNYHVVENAAKLTVSVNGIERDATYVGGDSSSDIAVVKVEDTEGLVSADIGDSDSLRIGEWVMTVGAPLGLESSVATGVVSATNRSTIMDSSANSNDLYSYFYGNQTPEYTYYPNMIQTDAVINPGNSGGALVDADGKLIGINAMISSYSGDYAGVGFAIPVNYAISLAKDIIDGKQPTHAMMGVSLSQVNSTVAQQYNLSTDSGAYVSAITEGTGAADSDLQIGDIITKIDGKAVASPTDVTLEIRAHKVGDTVTVTVNRDGELKDIEVILGSDENVSATGAQESEQGQDQREGQDMGQDPRDNGRGDGDGFSREELEELLKMLGY
ncbi:MAG: trypsin-like peptidase domain-containing protein [Eggerthellaceae bacterium]|nr:trypsin-like peptidase domain-containing protein [Eggerthellaceae bacterium]